MEKKLTRGLFITFEGPEGCGKSTQSSRLARDLANSGYPAEYTLEPGGTALGHKIRQVLLEKDDIEVNQAAELFLFEADRAQHVTEVIKPALESGKVVLCDRFSTATFAYQGYGFEMDLKLVEDIDGFATGGLAPDLIILLDIDVETGLKRANKDRAADKMEKRSLDFHNKVRQGYLAMAKEDPERIRVISSDPDVDIVYQKVKEEVYGFIEKHTGSA